MIDCGTYRFDRCDKCGAKALHAVVLPTADGGHELMFCEHHYRKLAGALNAVPGSVHMVPDDVAV